MDRGLLYGLLRDQDLNPVSNIFDRVRDLGDQLYQVSDDDLLRERDIDFFSTHLLSPRDGLGVVLDRQTLLRPSEGPALTADIKQRSQESEDAESWVRRLSTSPILAGDFNMPTDSSIYRRDWAKYRNAFSDAGLGCGYTEWPRIRGFSWGVRIDHILTAGSWRPRRCWVGPDIGSDHLPLVADLVWVPSDDAP